MLKKNEFDLSFKITLIVAITARTRAKEFGLLVQGSYSLFNLVTFIDLYKTNRNLSAKQVT